jgi:hypothetical protein
VIRHRIDEGMSRSFFLSSPNAFRQSDAYSTVAASFGNAAASTCP